MNAWPDWRNFRTCRGEYAWRWLPWHLGQAERKQDIERILWDPQWMHAKLRATDINALIAGLRTPEAVGRSGTAVRVRCGFRPMCWRPIRSSFASQLVGRLLPHGDVPAIRHVSGKNR